MLPRIAAAFRGGDNHLLTGVAKLIEQEGFRVRRRARSRARDLGAGRCAWRGAAQLRATAPTSRSGSTICERPVRSTSGRRWWWPTATCSRSRRRKAPTACWHGSPNCAPIGRIRAPVGTGVLVKAPKPAQDRRFDLPSIGPKTVEGVVRAGLAGLAVVAGETIVAEPEQMVIAADRAGIFVVGVCRIGAMTTGTQGPAHLPGGRRGVRRSARRRIDRGAAGADARPGARVGHRRRAYGSGGRDQPVPARRSGDHGLCRDPGAAAADPAPHPRGGRRGHRRQARRAGDHR